MTDSVDIMLTSPWLDIGVTLSMARAREIYRTEDEGESREQKQVQLEGVVVEVSQTYIPTQRAVTCFC